MNQYHGLRLLTPSVATGAQLANDTKYSVDAINAQPASLALPIMKLAGGPHPTGGTLMFGAPAADTSDGDTMTAVLYAMKRAGENARLAVALSAAITLTLSTKTLDIEDRDGGTVTLRMADTIGAVTLTGYGTSLENKYAAFTPEAHSPADNTVAKLLLASLPGMAELAIDLYGTGAKSRYVWADSHT